MDYLLLFHECRIRNVIDDILAKYRSCQHRVDLFGVYIFELAVQYKLVSLWAKVDGDFATE